MASKITANLGPEGLILHIPIDLLTQLLKPRVVLANGIRFTAREKEVLDGVIQGLANKEIAKKLNVSQYTIKFHVSSLLAKTKVRSRFDLQMLYLIDAKNGAGK